MKKYVITLDHIILQVKEASDKKARKLFEKMVNKNTPNDAGLYRVEKGDLIPLIVLQSDEQWSMKQRPQGALH